MVDLTRMILGEDDINHYRACEGFWGPKERNAHEEDTHGSLKNPLVWKADYFNVMRDLMDHPQVDRITVNTEYAPEGHAWKGRSWKKMWKRHINRKILHELARIAEGHKTHLSPDGDTIVKSHFFEVEVYQHNGDIAKAEIKFGEYNGDLVGYHIRVDGSISHMFGAKEFGRKVPRYVNGIWAPPEYLK